tara:strand:+ start:3737 stop:4021 length:285 start_codon:yes stop_codon:yes gene_type:complete
VGDDENMTPYAKAVTAPILASPESTRELVRVVIGVGYVVYKDDLDMLDRAKAALCEDVMNSVKYNELDAWVQVIDSPSAKESDIPEFLLDNPED